jgi:multicomponent Na+:H+ antiporter subunit D
VTRIEDLAGLYKRAPFLAVGFMIVGLSLAGVPPFAGFWPKVYLIQAGHEAGSAILVVGILVSGFLTLVAVGRAFALMFWREREGDAPLDTSGPLVIGSLSALAAMTFIIGLYSAPVVEMSNRSAAELLSPEPYIRTVLDVPLEARTDTIPTGLLSVITEAAQ